MTEIEALKVVETINDEILSRGEQNSFLFRFESDGTCYGVKFLGEWIWDSENDEREKGDNGAYEPLISYLYRKAGEFIETATKQFLPLED